MHVKTRYIVLSLLSVVSLTSFAFNRSSVSESLHELWNPPPKPPPPDRSPSAPRANATLLMLAREHDLPGVLSSIESLESRFNHRWQYPWVLLNEVGFSDTFKANVSAATNASVSFGVIPPEHWYQPEWIDEDRAREGRKRLKNTLYGDSVSYRNMCRFNSGFFFKHELVQPYRWYWRVEPDVSFRCDVDFDPFWYMEDHNKTYSFVISMKEIPETVPSFWNATQEFVAQHPSYIAKENSMRWISPNRGRTFNYCHWWSNFEIADLDFFRGEAYSKFFAHLDAQGGFYYERWGDAPVHSVAAALFLPTTRIHFFRNIGYTHAPFMHCPLRLGERNDANCDCRTGENFDAHPLSCTTRWLQHVQPAHQPWRGGGVWRLEAGS